MTLLLSLLTVLAYTLFIRFFKGFRQYEREEGPKSHKIKNGTVTMGGLIFVIIPLFFIRYDKEIIPISFAFISYAILGFIDDILIIIKKNNNGLKPSIKLLIELVIAGISFYFILKNNISREIIIFNYSLDLKWAYGLLVMFMLVASSNAFNLTDGIDGLCSGIALIMSVALIYIAYEQYKLNICYMLICIDIALFIFLSFNLPKAFIFMGDTGSLALGALFAIVAIYLGCMLEFIILASIYIFEALSVILQVAYYKKTHRRIFKMAPFHHHLEAIGFKEIHIDLLAYVIELILASIIILAY